MHKQAMLLLRKSQSHSVTEYAPIAKATSMLNSDTEAIPVKEFEIACFVCTEVMAFLKMGPMCQLEEKHRVARVRVQEQSGLCCVCTVYNSSNEGHPGCNAKFFYISHITPLLTMV